MRLLNMMYAKESGQVVECAVVFVKVYYTKDGHPISTEVGDKINCKPYIVTYFFCILCVNYL